MKKIMIAPSILSADFSNLRHDIDMVEKAGADWLHIDVMDGHFVPNITIGPLVVKNIRKHTKLFFDVHLMIEEPEKYSEEFMKAGADSLTVHAEACVHLHRNIQQINQLGMRAGVAINPHTPVSSLQDVLGDIDLVCMMSVNPGFGGQHFIPGTFRKLNTLNEMRHLHGASLMIEVDGGVTLENAAELGRHGADALVAGNSVFGTDDPAAAIRALGA